MGPSARLVWTADIRLSCGMLGNRIFKWKAVNGKNHTATELLNLTESSRMVSEILLCLCMCTIFHQISSSKFSKIKRMNIISHNVPSSPCSQRQMTRYCDFPVRTFWRAKIAQSCGERHSRINFVSSQVLTSVGDLKPRPALPTPVYRFNIWIINSKFFLCGFFFGYIKKDILLRFSSFRLR